MTATTTDRVFKRREGNLVQYGIKSGATIYAGTFVLADTTGYAINGVSTYPYTSYTYLGVAACGETGDASTSGKVTVDVWKTGEFLMDINLTTSVVAQTYMGDEVYIHDNKTVRNYQITSTNNIKVGVITGLGGVTYGSNSVWVRIDGYTENVGAQATTTKY